MKVLALYESKTNKSFVRKIPDLLYNELMKERNTRKAQYDDDPDKYSEDYLTYIFTFRTRQAAHKRLKKLKEQFPALKNWEFGQHDLRRLKAR